MTLQHGGLTTNTKLSGALVQKDLIDFSELHQPVPFTGKRKVRLHELESFLRLRNVDMNPPYRHARAWSHSRRERFMGHLLTGGHVVPIIIHRASDGMNQEMLDGKQRVVSMIDWMHGRLGARLCDGRLIKIDDLLKIQFAGQLVPAGVHAIMIGVRYVNVPPHKRKQYYEQLHAMTCDCV